MRTLKSSVAPRLLGSAAGTYVDLPARSQDSSGLRITMPSAGAPFAAAAYVVKLTFSGPIPALGPAPVAVSVYTDDENRS